MLEDCFKYYKGCQACKRFGKIQMVLASVMNPIVKPWPFRGWGMDIIGKINPPSSKGHQFILAIIDYFTKWVEAVLMKSVASKDVINFVREHVIHRFGIPQTITTDGGSVFISEEFKRFATDMGIKLIRSSPYYAQVNGQAKASNQSLIKLIRGITGIPYFMPRSNENFSLPPGVWTGGCITMGDYGRLETHRVPK
jgi:hypothetical protein